MKKTLSHIVLSLISSLLISIPTLAADFVCSGVHGDRSIVRVEEKMVTAEKSVSFKVLPEGQWEKAEVIEAGDGWVLFTDRYGLYNSDKACKKYTKPCGALINLFYYGKPKGDNYAVEVFTTKACCHSGRDLEKGSRVSFINSMCF